MCTNPHTLWHWKEHLDYRGSLDLTLLPEYMKKIFDVHSEGFTVPCGKCIECQKARQNSLALRAARCAEKYGSMQFLTLTYEDRFLPFAMRLYKVDLKTGEYLEYQNSVIVERDHPMYANLTRQYHSIRDRGRNSIRITYSPISNLEVQFTPSLCRRDVRLWLKRCRVYYEREFGEKLPDFKYICLGEYGPNTCRPHYHLCFFGLSYKQVLWMSSEWIYGYTCLKSVKATNEDGSPGFVIAAKYISKYISKGKFECDSVLDKIAEKPRVCQSIKIGALDDDLKKFYRCEDLYPDLDLNACTYSGKHFTEQELLDFSNEVKKRSTIKVCGQEFPLPSIFLKQIWYEKYNSQLLSTPLRRIVSTILRDQDFASFCERVPETWQDDPEILTHLAFYETNEQALALREFRSEEVYCKQLYKSFF